MISISIITVSLNNLKGLQETFYSLSHQSDKEFEWIIKDGDSQDMTSSFYKSNIENSGLNSRLIVLKDKSLYDAMNQAIRYAGNKYVLFLNAGDCLAENSTIQNIRKSVNYDKEFSFIYGDNIDIIAGGINIYKKSRKLSYLASSLPTSHQAIFYNRNLLDRFSYSPEYKIAADYALTATIYYSGYTDYCRLDIPICKFLLGGESTKYRKILLREGYLIHRKIVKNNYFLAMFKLYKRFFTFFLLDRMPNLYGLLRKIG